VLDTLHLGNVFNEDIFKILVAHTSILFCVKK
jgi:hypothetical protein